VQEFDMASSFSRDVSARVSGAPTAWVEIEREDDRLVHLSAHGEFDVATAETLRLPLLSQLLAGRRAVALDMSAVTFVDVVVIDMLVGAQQDYIASGATLLITNPSRQVSRLMHLAGLDRKLLAAHRLSGGVPG
jgi:anti-sigma B factor antagonist